MNVTVETPTGEQKFEAHKIECDAGVITIYTDKEKYSARKIFLPSDNVFITIDKELSISDVFENE